MWPSIMYKWAHLPWSTGYLRGHAMHKLLKKKKKKGSPLFNNLRNCRGSFAADCEPLDHVLVATVNLQANYQMTRLPG